MALAGQPGRATDRRRRSTRAFPLAQGEEPDAPLANAGKRGVQQRAVRRRVSRRLSSIRLQSAGRSPSGASASSRAAMASGVGGGAVGRRAARPASGPGRFRAAASSARLTGVLDGHAPLPAGVQRAHASCRDTSGKRDTRRWRHSPTARPSSDSNPMGEKNSSGRCAWGSSGASFECVGAVDEQEDFVRQRDGRHDHREILGPAFAQQKAKALPSRAAGRRRPG